MDDRISQCLCERIAAAILLHQSIGLMREGHQVLLPAPNSRNPNLMPIGDGFGFLFVFDDLTV
jgi:hypothetical protein